MRKKGLFIAVDGPSASGKDTIIKHILKDLNKLKINVISIEETKEANYDRKKILLAKTKGDKELSKTIINERKKIYQEKVIPQFHNGIIIIANRGEPSTLSYQTLKNEITMDEIWNMHRQQNILLPDLVVITNCSVKEAIRREKLRKQSLEEKDKNFLSGKFTSARKQIHINYQNVKDFLKRKRLAVIYLKTDTMNISKESHRIVNFIKNKINYLHE